MPATKNSSTSIIVQPSSISMASDPPAEGKKKRATRKKKDPNAPAGPSMYLSFLISEPIVAIFVQHGFFFQAVHTRFSSELHKQQLKHRIR